MLITLNSKPLNPKSLQSQHREYLRPDDAPDHLYVSCTSSYDSYKGIYSELSKVQSYHRQPHVHLEWPRDKQNVHRRSP